MSESQRPRRILAQAKEKEKEYNWLGAIEFYEKDLDRVLKQKDFLEAGEIEERIGHCFYRAAFQAETNEHFKKRMQLAVRANNQAAEYFGKAKKWIRGDYCNVLAICANRWIAPSCAEKRVLLDRGIRLWKKVATDYEKAGDLSRYGRACNELLECLLDRFEIEQKWNIRRKILTEGLDYGKKAIATFGELADDYELTRAYYLTSFHGIWAARYGEFELRQREKLNEQCLTFAKRALDFSEKVGDSPLIAMSNLAATFNQYWLVGDLNRSLEHAKEVLHHGKITCDHNLIGLGLIWLADITYWMMMQEEDPNKKREGYNTTIQYAKEAASHLNLLSPYAYSGETVWVQVDSYTSWAQDVETKPQEKRTLLERAVNTGRKAIEYIERSGNPEGTSSTLHALSKALFFISQMETALRNKKEDLTEALKFRETDINLADQAFPQWYWYRGVGYNYQALIMAELSLIESNDKKKRELLETAVLNMEKCLKLCSKWVTSHPQTMLLVPLGMYYDWFGKILNQLYQLTREIENLQKMIEAYQRAVEAYGKANLSSRLAESYWQIAKAKDKLGEHLESAENFESASKGYKTSAEKMPHLNEFYMDYASYMQAWSEIEKARHYHAKRKYGQAKKSYEKAASLHKSCKSWKYLASNYLAWAQLEQGEDFSRNEQSQEAIEAFQRAVELFHEAEKTLRVVLDTIERRDEKELAERLIKASDTRGKYCLGRIAVEEAKILDRRGDHTASSKRYGEAAETFQEIVKAESEQTRRELKPLIYLCRAWEKMMMGEARSSPIMYEEAAELFKQAKEHAVDQPTSLLALANSSFCKALEAGTEFEITRDTTLHSSATQHLGSAANHYLKAGFKTASEYAKATQRLFDAYVYMDNAKKEADPDKEARYYIMAEKVLQASAGSYLKAKHPEKSKQVQRLLEKVREERQLAMSLSEVLHAPTVTSSTASFATLTPGEEKAVGLERFEHANLQANLIQHAEEVRVGEDFDLEVQIVNVGKQTVLLDKVEGILPLGFEPVAKPDYCSFEDAYVDMKGKRLDPLKTEEVKLVLRSFDKGRFSIKPRIVYVDEAGHQMLCEPEPVSINVSGAVLPGRISTGYRGLDNLLFGGIPKNYAVILTSPSCDERDLLVKSFLEAGAKEGQITFFVAIETTGVKTLVEEFQSNFYLLLCNPRADSMIKTLPNVFKLKGVENLTNIDIALNSAFRRLEESPNKPRRACIEIVSDVLLQHQAVMTRRWLTGLIPELRSKGFTTLAVMNPQMHSLQEVHAILGLFEGEISIFEEETKKGLEKFLKIKKMYNQKYLETPLPLKKEMLKI